MLILSAPAPGQSGVAPNMVVTHDKVPPDLPPQHPERMHALLEKQVSEMREKMNGFKELWRNVDGTYPVAEIMINWVTPQAPVGQWVTFAELTDGRLMVATATAGRDEFDEHHPTFRKMLESLSQPT